eukprot:4762758-Amphidinium_carterae.2
MFFSRSLTCIETCNYRDNNGVGTVLQILIVVFAMLATHSIAYEPRCGDAASGLLCLAMRMRGANWGCTLHASSGSARHVDS